MIDSQSSSLWLPSRVGLWLQIGFKNAIKAEIQQLNSSCFKSYSVLFGDSCNCHGWPAGETLLPAAAGLGVWGGTPLIAGLANVRPDDLESLLSGWVGPNKKHCRDDVLAKVWHQHEVGLA